MGLFQFLFGKREPRRPAYQTIDIQGPGEFGVDAVGESNYQPAISSVVGGRNADGHRAIVTAVLVLEDSNKYDKKAVAVMIEGKLCGYLDRETARSYRKQIAKAGHPKSNLSCQAMIVGGWDRGPEDKGFFGVKIDLPVA